MNSILFCIMAILGQQFAHAEGFSCVPSLKQTSIRLEKKDKVIKLFIQNPMGYDYMPQFDGPTSKSSLPMQQMQFADLFELGSMFTLEWSESKCATDFKNKIINCDGATESKVKGMQSFLLSTTEITEKTRGAQYKKFRYRFNIDKEGTQYFVSLEFYDMNCNSN